MSLASQDSFEVQSLALLSADYSLMVSMVMKMSVAMMMAILVEVVRGMLMAMMVLVIVFGWYYGVGDGGESDDQNIRGYDYTNLPEAAE